MKPHHVVIVLGLGELKNSYVILTKNWEQKYHLIPHIYNIGWKNNNENYDQKLNKLNAYVSSLVSKDTVVSLMGISAGASMIFNSFITLKRKRIHINGAVISICGRFNKNTHWWYPFTHYSEHFPQFTASIENFEQMQDKLTKEDKKRMFTFSALFDEVAPYSTSNIIGVNIKRINFISHVPSTLYMFFFGNKLQNLLKLYSQ